MKVTSEIHKQENMKGNEEGQNRALYTVVMAEEERDHREETHRAVYSSSELFNHLLFQSHLLLGLFLGYLK